MRAVLLFLLFASASLAEDPKAVWLAEFAYEPSKFEATVEQRFENKEYTQYKVTFPSAVTSDHESNNTVHGHLVVPRKNGTGAAVIILPIWKGGAPNLEMIVAKRLAQEGVTAFVMALPYQFERAPEGERSGNLTVSSDLERTRTSIVQSVKDVKRSAQWLVEERKIGRERLGVMGISLGGHVAALVWAIDPQFKACSAVLAGGNIHELFWNESKETAEMKEELVAKGVTLEELREVTRPFDPVTWATPERREGLLLVAAKDDPVVPIRNVRALRDAFGKPRLVIFPGNHYSVVVFMADMLDELGAHFTETFGKSAK